MVLFTHVSPKYNTFVEDIIYLQMIFVKLARNTYRIKYHSTLWYVLISNMILYEFAPFKKCFITKNGNLSCAEKHLFTGPKVVPHRCDFHTAAAAAKGPQTS